MQLGRSLRDPEIVESVWSVVLLVGSKGGIYARGTRRRGKEEQEVK
jgi:hypothetical protein